MRVINDYKLVNVRVSGPTFEFVKSNAPFILSQTPSETSNKDTLLKGQIIICHDYDIEKLMQILDKRSYEVSETVIKAVLVLKAELNDLLITMKRGGYIFTHIMAE